MDIDSMKYPSSERDIYFLFPIIKKSYKSYYVYKSTTVWNKELKKRDKNSTYIGKLNKETGLIIESSKKIITQCKVEKIKQYGNAALLNIAMKDLQKLLKEVFGDIWEEINFAEKGVNKDKIHIPQVNLALLCSANDGMPTMIRAIPGSVRDITSLYNSIKEIGLAGKTLILDRGFFSDKLMDFLIEKHLSFIIPARRNSTLYGYLVKLNKHFFFCIKNVMGWRSFLIPIRLR